MQHLKRFFHYFILDLKRLYFQRVKEIASVLQENRDPCSITLKTKSLKGSLNREIVALSLTLRIVRLMLLPLKEDCDSIISDAITSDIYLIC